MPQPTVQNELFTRLTNCAKTAAQWANTVGTPMLGEPCWEIQEAQTVTGLPYSYRLKIGDGTTSYANLPYYGDFVTLHTDNNTALSVAVWDASNSRLNFYKVTETNGIVALEQNPYLGLNAGSKVTISTSTVGGVNILSINHQEQSAGDVTEDTVTLTDGGTFKVATQTDSYGHVTKWTTFTLPSIATALTNAISALDSSVATSGNVYVLTGITESDGKLTAKTETQIVGGTNMSVVGASGSITINHDAINTSATDAAAGITTDNSSTVGEKDVNVITGLKIDAQGHVTHIDKDKSTNMLAADIKAPVPQSNTATWRYRETGDSISINEDTAALNKLDGQTLVWNQLINITSTSDDKGVTATLNNDGTVTLNGTANDTGYISCNFTPTYLISGHKVLLYSIGTRSAQIPSGNTSGFSTENGGTVITIGQSGNEYRVWLRFNSGDSFSNKKVYTYLIDLTKMFGETIANSMTVELFEKLFSLPYYNYNEGQLLNVKVNALKTVGFNQWDEQWELGNIIEGSNVPTTTRIRSTNYNPCIAGQKYYLCGSGYGTGLDLHWYRADKSWIKKEAKGWGLTVDAPDDAAYFRFVLWTDTTYHHDICINLTETNGTDRDGTYEPYWTDTTDIPITGLTGINSVTSNREVMFPDGLKSAGSIKDVIQGGTAVKRIGAVDLGTLEDWSYNTLGNGEMLAHLPIPGQVSSEDYTIMYSTIFNGICPIYTPTSWGNIFDGGANKAITYRNNSGVQNSLIVKDSSYTDAATFKAAMSGVMLNYELATPITYTNLQYPDGRPFELPLNYRVDDLGTEEWLPEQTASKPVNYPEATITYKSNFKDAVLDLFDKVNNYKNPVQSKTGNTPQTVGKIAVYDTDHSTESSEYSVNSGSINPSATDNDKKVPTVEQVVGFVGSSSVQDITTTDDDTAGNGGVRVTHSGTTYDVHHDPITQVDTEHTITASEGNSDEGVVEVVTNVSVDAFGHIKGKETISSDNLIAADIKAPVKVDNNNMFTFRETGDPVSISEDAAKIKVIKGNTINFNQAVKSLNVSSEIYGITRTATNDYTLHYSGTCQNSTDYTAAKYDSVPGHKYYKSAKGIPSNTRISDSSINGTSSVITTAENTTDSINIYIEQGTTIDADVIPIAIDLTKMFGEAVANSMTTAQFEAMFPAPYYPYCESRLINLGGYHVKLNQTLNESKRNYTNEDTDVRNFFDPRLLFWTESTNYSSLGIGSNMYSPGTVSAIFTIPQTVKALDFRHNGLTLDLVIVGKSAVTEGHVYYLYCNATSVNPSQVGGLVVNDNMLIDLTTMFGSGSEPSTVEEVEAILSLIKAQKGITDDYIPYTEGEDMNPVSELGIESIGRNLWDKNNLSKGYYNVSTGVFNDNAYYYLSDFIPVFAGKTYYFSKGLGAGSGGSVGIAYFDSNKKWVSGSYIPEGGDDAFTRIIPDGVSYMRVSSYNEYVEAVNFNCCINVSDDRNGTIDVYRKDTLDLSFIKDLGIPDFNIWDEEWEEGAINYTTGQNETTEYNIRSINYIPVISNKTYYLASANAAITIFFYDLNKNFLSRTYFLYNVEFTTPNTCEYIRFYTYSDYGTTYNHDICINKSVPGINGIYLPYGEKYYYFKYGLTSVGDITDEAYETYANKKMLLLDMGDLNWGAGGTLQSGVYKMACNLNGLIKPTSNADVVANILTPKYDTISANSVYSLHTGISVDSSTIGVYDANYNTDSSISAFKAAMKGVPLIIELETPVRIDYPEPHNFNYAVDDHGTEALIPQNTSNAVVTAPFAGTITYMSNFKDAVLDIINRVNGYKNPVKGVNDSLQTVGKLAVYDSEKTVHSSNYSPSNATIVPTGENNEVILPSVAAIVAYVQQIASSPLNYQGTVASYAALPSSGTNAGDVWILSTDDATAGYQAGDWFVRNKANTGWDVIQGTISVTNSNPNIVFNGSTYTIGYVEGTPLQLTTPNLQMSDPTANGYATGLEVITNVSQTNGQMDATKKYIPGASVSQKGVVQLERDIHYSESNDKVPTAKQTWREFSKRNVKAVPISVVPVPAVYNTDLFASYELEASSSPSFTVNNSTFAQVYAANMGGYLFYVNNGVVYAAKMKASDWTKFDDNTTITSAIRAATETMIHVPTCNYKASGTKMKFGGLNPLYGGDYFKSPRWVGAYQMDINGHSRPGVGSGYSKTMTEFWNLAQAIHSDFGLANYEFHNLINALYQAMFGNLNSEYVLSDNNSRSSSNWDSYRDLAHGAADSLADGAFVTGPHCVAAVDGTGVTRYVTKFCGFEDLFGKLWEFRPGIRFYMDNGVRKAVVYDGNVVSNTADGRIISGVLSSASGEYTTAMELGEHWDMLSKTVGGSSTTYYCDGYWASTGGVLLVVGSYAYNGSQCGIAYSSSDVGFGEASGVIGARLAFYGEPIIVSGAEMVAMMA